MESAKVYSNSMVPLKYIATVWYPPKYIATVWYPPKYIATVWYRQSRAYFYPPSKYDVKIAKLKRAAKCVTL